MLYGCCVNLLPKTLDRIGLEYAGRLKRLGYDYIELPLNELAQLSEQEFRDARTVLEELDLPCRSCNDFMPARFQITGPDVTSRAELTDYLRRALERAAWLGVPYTVFGSPWSRSCPEATPGRRLWSDRRISVPCGGGGRPMSDGHFHRDTTGARPTCSTTSPTGYGWPARWTTPMSGSCATTTTCGSRGTPPLSCWMEGESCWSTPTSPSWKAAATPLTYLWSPRWPEYAGVLRQIGYAGGVSVESKVDAPEHWEEQAALALANLRQVLG